MPLGHELGSRCQRKSCSTQRVNVNEKKNYQHSSSFGRDMKLRTSESVDSNISLEINHQ